MTVEIFAIHLSSDLKTGKNRRFSENLNKIPESLKFLPSKHEKLNAAGKTEIFHKTSSIHTSGYQTVKDCLQKKSRSKEIVFFGKAKQAFAEGIIEITKFF